MCGWKGFTATRLYLCKNERMHYLNLCAYPLPEHLLPNKNNRRARAEDDKVSNSNGNALKSKNTSSAADSDAVEKQNDAGKIEDASDTEVPVAKDNSSHAIDEVTTKG